MKRLLILLKKDITLDKGNWLIVLLVSVGLPIYIINVFAQSGFAEAISFLTLCLNAFYCFFLVYSKLGMIENKYRGMAYMTLTPVTRKEIVLSKYLLSIVVFLISIVGYGLANLVLPLSQPFAYSSVIMAWAVNAVLTGIYIPLEFKVGYENVKYYLMAIIVALPFLMGLLGKYTGYSFFSIWKQNGRDMLPVIFVFSLLLYIASYYGSVKIFEKKDL